MLAEASFSTSPSVHETARKQTSSTPEGHQPAPSDDMPPVKFRYSLSRAISERTFLDPTQGPPQLPRNLALVSLWLPRAQAEARVSQMERWPPAESHPIG